MVHRIAPPLVATSVLMAFCLFGGRQVVAQTQVDTLLDGSSLQDLWVHVNARDWEDLHTHFQDNTYYPADVEWQGTRVRNAAIRVRGVASRNGHKPSFRLDFNRYVTGQTFFGLDALTLDSSWQDPSMITNRLSMALFRKMGIPAPRVAHVRLFAGAGRDYVGVYAVTEEVVPSFLRANFGEDTGYLYEFNHLSSDDWGFQDPGPLGWYVPRFSPKTHDTESVAQLYSPIRDLVQRINDAPPSDLESRLSGYLDLDTFIMELAIQNFVMQTDGLVGGVGANNFYLYRYAGKNLSILIPWDQGNAFGWFDDVPPWWNMDTNVLASKIWNDPKYRARYLAALLRIADVVSADDWLLQEAQGDYQQIRDAVYQDALAPYPLTQFEQTHVAVQQFIRMRPDSVRQFVAGLTQ